MVTVFKSGNEVFYLSPVLESKMALSSDKEGSSMTLKVVLLVLTLWFELVLVLMFKGYKRSELLAGIRETMLFMASSRPLFHLGSTSRMEAESSGGVAKLDCLPQLVPESLRSPSSPEEILERLHESGLFRESYELSLNLVRPWLDPVCA